MCSKESGIDSSSTFTAVLQGAWRPKPTPLTLWYAVRRVKGSRQARLTPDPAEGLAEAVPFPIPLVASGDPAAEERTGSGFLLPNASRHPRQDPALRVVLRAQRPRIALARLREI